MASNAFSWLSKSEADNSTFAVNHLGTVLLMNILLNYLFK